jgi:hypothetical protein
MKIISIQTTNYNMILALKSLEKKLPFLQKTKLILLRIMIYFNKKIERADAHSIPS